jgi:hypothetical protein
MAMIDLKGLFPTVTAFIAFIITILCLFAGTQKNFLSGADLFTVSPILPHHISIPTLQQKQNKQT